MKYKVKTIKQEGGITLIALIITIIVLVILAAVTLNSLFGNNIIGIAVNGTINYAEEQQKELGMLNDVSDMLGEITGDTDKPMMPTITLSGTKENNDIYTSNVTVTISINKGIEQTGSIKLHYKINDGEEQITEEDVSFEVDTEGTTKITAWTENEKGNLSDKYEISFTINKTAPSTPTIALNGTEGENGYYKSNVGVTISAGDTANVASIKYKVEGANPISETEVQGAITNFDITVDGTSTITAYIINTAGLTSEEITQVVNKDMANPSKASLAVGTIGETSISVTANGEDATSGVGSYIFQYSTTSETEGFTTAEEVQNTSNSCTYTYQSLASNTTYYLRVVVKDRAGNTLPSTAVSTTTKKAGMSDTELASNVGKYVDYVPVSGSFTSEEKYNGMKNQNFSTDTSLKWMILFADNNILTLISDNSVNDGFYLVSENGYNNGVLLLNNACKAMYSNSSFGATGRSLKIEDIESVSSYGAASNKEYSPTYTLYPNIFAQEVGGAPNGNYNGTLGRSEQNSYVTGYSSGSSSFKGRETSYSYTMSSMYMNQKYIDLFTCYSTDRNWLASRCVLYNSNSFSFNLFWVKYNEVDGYNGNVFNSGGGDVINSAALRPIVDIDLSQVNVGLTGNGEYNTPYSIEAK